MRQPTREDTDRFNVLTESLEMADKAVRDARGPIAGAFGECCRGAGPGPTHEELAALERLEAVAKQRRDEWDALLQDVFGEADGR